MKFNVEIPRQAWFIQFEKASQDNKNEAGAKRIAYRYWYYSWLEYNGA